jgi:hypothetical protein
MREVRTVCQSSRCILIANQETSNKRGSRKEEVRVQGEWKGQSEHEGRD